jgi:hypothetical protein
MWRKCEKLLSAACGENAKNCRKILRQCHEKAARRMLAECAFDEPAHRRAANASWPMDFVRSLLGV